MPAAAATGVQDALAAAQIEASAEHLPGQEGVR